MATVLVTGGTGKLGRAIVPRLLAAGRLVRVLTRSAASPVPSDVAVVRGDLGTGEGLERATAGADVVVHAASSFADPWQTDVEGTRRLVAALTGAGSSAHLVYVSIVGVDRSSLPYYEAKHAAEHVLRDAGLPWSILRATQFHGFALSLLESLIDGGGALTVPGDVRLQPVAVDEVAARLVDIALGGATRRVDSFGGPEVLTLEAMARAYREASGVPADVRTGRVENPILEAWRSSHHLAPGHADGRLTWSQFLARTYAGSAATAGGRREPR